MHFEANSTWVLLECILESLYCPLSQPIRGGVIGSTCQMADTIAADECSKLLTGESGTVIRHDNLREPMSGEDQLEFINSGLGSSRGDCMSLYPF